MSIGAVDPALTDRATESAAFDGLGSDAFLNLMVAQLQYQDPLSPMDPTAMMTQTSQLAAMEATQNMADLQAQLLGYSQFQTGSQMLGREVSVISESSAEPITGVVTGVRATGTGPLIRLDDGSEHRVDAVTSVAAPESSTPTQEVTPS